VTAALAGGWVVAGLLALWLAALRRRLSAVADATHEVRGAASTMALATAAIRREPGGIRLGAVLESEFERLRCGLSDLDAARFGGRAGRPSEVLSLDRVVRRAAAGWRPVAGARGRRLNVRWDGPPVAVRADRGRLAQALGNLLANAFEHGSGPIDLRGRSDGAAVVVEVADRGPGDVPGPARAADRGRGLGIAARAVEDAGGTLTIRQTGDGTVAAVEIPVARR
jgi:signal transduction histidine kinase